MRDVKDTPLVSPTVLPVVLPDLTESLPTGVLAAILTYLLAGLLSGAVLYPLSGLLPGPVLAPMPYPVPGPDDYPAESPAQRSLVVPRRSRASAPASSLLLAPVNVPIAPHQRAIITLATADSWAGQAASARCAVNTRDSDARDCAASRVALSPAR